MIVDNARGFVDGSPNPETKAAQARPQERKRGYEQTGQKPQEMTCFNCGSKDHFWRECPKKSNSNTPPPNQETGQPYKAGPKRTGKGVPKGPPPKRGERGAKGSGRRSKEGPKNETPKSRPKRPPTPPGARAAQEWDEEATERSRGRVSVALHSTTTGAGAGARDLEIWTPEGAGRRHFALHQ